MCDLMRYLTSSQAARELGISAQTLTRWVDAEKVESLPTPLGRLFAPEKIRALVVSRSSGHRE